MPLSVRPTLAALALVILAPVVGGCSPQATDKLVVASAQQEQHLAQQGESRLHYKLAHESWSGSQSSVLEVEQRVVTTQPEWQAAWKDIGEPPPTTFEPSMTAAVVFMGQRTTGGFEVNLKGINSSADGNVVVVCEFHKPAPGEGVTRGFVHPWLVVLLPDPVELKILCESS